jgi:hypothetical protein
MDKGTTGALIQVPNKRVHKLYAKRQKAAWFAISTASDKEYQFQ